MWSLFSSMFLLTPVPCFLSVFHICSLIVKLLCGMHWVRGIGLKWSSSDCRESIMRKASSRGGVVTRRRKSSVGHETVPPTSRVGSIPSVHKPSSDHKFVGCGVRHPKHRTQNSHQLNPQAINWPSVRFSSRKPGGSENRCHRMVEI